MRKIFIIGYVWPEPTASAAGIRMLQLIRFFREQDYEVHFGTQAMVAANAFDLGKMGVHLHAVEVNDDGFNDLVKSMQPDVVLFDRYMIEEQFSWRVAENCPDAIRILDTEDLHFLRKFRQGSGGGSKEEIQGLLQDSLAKREVASIYRSDLSLIISEAEMELLEQVFRVPGTQLVYHPLFAEDSLLKNREDLPAYEDRRDMMFIGNFLHEPNADAIKVLEGGVWKAVRKALPEVNLHIYGAYMPESRQGSSASENGMIFHGRATDVDQVMQKARLCLAPLRFGAGLKGKLIRAMENGLPSVTTPVGAEGIAGNMEWAGAIAELPTSFIDSVLSLYQDKVSWSRAVNNGFEIIDRRFLRAPFEKVFLQRINALYIDIQAHRGANFTGQMLMDQRNMAARYLSKYIMAKNRK